MMAGTKKRPMTQREKRERAKVKKELQEKGILPPDKPRLNRKKYIDESEELWNNRPDDLLWDVFLHRGISWMLAARNKEGNYSEQALGVAKVLRCALALQELYRQKKEDGGKITLGDEYDALEAIMKA